MKWIGQHIYDLVSRFRDDVYLEDVTASTVGPCGDNTLLVDGDGKIYKNTSAYCIH